MCVINTGGHKCDRFDIIRHVALVLQEPRTDTDVFNNLLTGIHTLYCISNILIKCSFVTNKLFLIVLTISSVSVTEDTDSAISE